MRSGGCSASAEPCRAHCAQVDELFREASLDANGMVNYDQFAKLMLAKARIASQPARMMPVCAFGTEPGVP